ncbi:MAG: hypothetical protein JXR60_02400 [Bacteroidales bacterium]|nr:hypothetical protein [Bacteroidales bacterium]
MLRFLNMRMIKYFSIIIFAFVLFLQTKAQSDLPLKYRLFAGGRYSSLLAPNDSVDVSPSVTGLGGLSLVYPIKDRLDLDFGAEAFFNKGVYNNDVKYRNAYLAATINLDWKPISYFSFTAGGNLAFLVESSLMGYYAVFGNGAGVSGALKYPMEGYQSYYGSLQFGFKLDLHKDVCLGVEYTLLLNDKSVPLYPNFNVKLTYTYDPATIQNRKKSKSQQALKADSAAKDLSKSALFIMLKSYKKQIDNAIEYEKMDLANKIIISRDEENTDIMLGFDLEFNYCPVYYFYIDDLNKILNRDFEGVLLNHDLKVDTTIHFTDSSFFIGTFGFAIQDTAISYSHSSLYKNGFNNAEGYITTANKETNYSNYGFIVYDDQLKILPKPFPRFISSYYAFAKRTPDNVAKLLNKKLHKLHH